MASRFTWSVDKHWSRRGFGGLGRSGFVAILFVCTLAAVAGAMMAIAGVLPRIAGGLQKEVGSRRQALGGRQKAKCASPHDSKGDIFNVGCIALTIVRACAFYALTFVRALCPVGCIALTSCGLVQWGWGKKAANGGSEPFDVGLRLL